MHVMIQLVVSVSSAKFKKDVSGGSSLPPPPVKVPDGERARGDYVQWRRREFVSNLFFIVSVCFSLSICKWCFILLTPTVDHTFEMTTATEHNSKYLN